MSPSIALTGLSLRGIGLAGLGALVFAGAVFGQSDRSPSPTLSAPRPPFELLVLGSGGPGATGRASSASVALIDGVPRVLIDAGSGAFVRLGEADLPLDALDTVLLTHLHVDHAGELAGLMKARAVSSSQPITFRIFGPGGSRGGHGGAYFPSTRQFIDLMFGPRGAFAYLRDFSAPITLQAHDVLAAPRSPREPRVLLSEPGWTVSAVGGHHGDAPAVIYRIDHGGASITFSGDIDPEGLAALARIARGTDLLVFNSVVLDPPDSPPILYSLHSPPRAIGEVAREAGVHALLLSHLSPATDQKRDAVLDSIRRSYQGPVQFAEDGMRVQP
jgi:ribonuclease BN (tRNA processing enzyme)